MHEQKLNYLQHCVSENLNHARHVENERLTFTSIYIAMVIGAVAVVFGLENNYVAFVLCLALFGFSLMAFYLNARWQGVFEEHMSKAKECQQRWIDGMKDPDSIGDLDANDFCYSFRSRPKERKLRWLWLMGYSLSDDPKNFKFPDLFKRTRHLFSVLFLAVSMLLFVLTIYLFYLATKSPVGGGFYFSSEGVQAMKEFLNEILEVRK